MSHPFSRMILALGAVAAALGLLGCQKPEGRTPSDTASQTMERAKEVTKNVDNKATDATLSAEVSVALAKDPGLSALKIDVDTSDGRVVLRGNAPDAQARDRATQLAQNVKGVVSVDNQLIVAKG